MSTADDTAFEELMSAEGEPPDPLHLVCAVCYPDSGPGTPCLCGHTAQGPPVLEGGRPVCAKCLALDAAGLPCGH